MTINITVFGDDYLLQSADRCVSVNGQPVTQLNKVVVFASDRLRLGVTYTGLAADDIQWLTDLWMCDVLCNSDLMEAAGHDVAEAFRHGANERNEGLSNVWRGIPTIFTFAGWDLVDHASRVLFQVHNCLARQGESSRSAIHSKSGTCPQTNELCCLERSDLTNDRTGVCWIA